MPDPELFDLDYRPETYWEFDDELAFALATVKGNHRREQLENILKDNPSAHTDPHLGAESLPKEELLWLARFNPSFASGEYLKDLKPCEVEIARVCYESTLSDVVSVRAQLKDGKIHYNVADDFSEMGENYSGYIPLTSDLPLTLGEMINLMDTASLQPDDDPGGWFTGLVQGPTLRAYQNAFRSDPCWWPETPTRFATVSSSVYPDLDRWYETVDDELHSKYQKQFVPVNNQMEKLK